MDTKTIYFVRHGETEFNEKRIHQHPDVALSKLGMEQAEFVAKRFLHIPVEVVVASPYFRTRQTTEAILSKLDIPVEYNDLFQELKRPSEMEGKRIDDPDMVTILNQIYEHSHESGWRYSDEETFEDSKMRADKAVSYLQGMSQNSILVVSHGGIIRKILACMMFKDRFDYQSWNDVRHFFVTSNTGITVCKYSVEHGWKLLTYNDHAHLG